MASLDMNNPVIANLVESKIAEAERKNPQLGAMLRAQMGKGAAPVVLPSSVSEVAALATSSVGKAAAALAEAQGARSDVVALRADVHELMVLVRSQTERIAEFNKLMADVVAMRATMERLDKALG